MKKIFIIWGLCIVCFGFLAIMFSRVTCNTPTISPIDYPMKVDLSKVNWMSGSSFEDLNFSKIAALVFTDDGKKFEDCEINLELPGEDGEFFPEFVEILDAISNSTKRTKTSFPVGGGKFWFVLENNYGISLDVYDTGKTVLMRDSFGEIRESEELWRIIEKLHEKTGVKTETPPTFEVPEGGFE